MSPKCLPAKHPITINEPAWKHLSSSDRKKAGTLIRRAIHLEKMCAMQASAANEEDWRKQNAYCRAEHAALRWCLSALELIVKDDS